MTASNGRCGRRGLRQGPIPADSARDKMTGSKMAAASQREYPPNLSPTHPLRDPY
jgi:hypothetical protein